MQFTSTILLDLIVAVAKTIEDNAEEVIVLDQVIGDGDHLINLQRGLVALNQQVTEIVKLEWASALQKIGTILLTTMGGASGSLFGTLFISMGKAAGDKKALNKQDFLDIYIQGVEAVKKRGKSEAGEKTLLDVLIPVAENFRQGLDANDDFFKLLEDINQAAIEGMKSTRDMLAKKGRASYLEEKSLGHIDAGARTSQLMICAITEVLMAGQFDA